MSILVMSSIISEECYRKGNTMKNTYFTSYFPLISILLFSASCSLAATAYVTELLQTYSIYNGMLEFLSANEIRIGLFIVFALIFFMLFSALKLIADTITELALLFFSKDPEGENLKKIRIGSVFYLGSSLVSLAFIQQPLFILAVILIATLSYFIFIVYKIQATLSLVSLIGFILFELIFWFAFVMAIFYVVIKLYNSIMASLPV